MHANSSGASKSYTQNLASQNDSKQHRDECASPVYDDCLNPEYIDRLGELAQMQAAQSVAESMKKPHIKGKFKTKTHYNCSLMTITSKLSQSTKSMKYNSQYPGSYKTNQSIQIPSTPDTINSDCTLSGIPVKNNLKQIASITDVSANSKVDYGGSLTNNHLPDHYYQLREQERRLGHLSLDAKKNSQDYQDVKAHKKSNPSLAHKKTIEVGREEYNCLHTYHPVQDDLGKHFLRESLNHGPTNIRMNIRLQTASGSNLHQRIRNTISDNKLLTPNIQETRLLVPNATASTTVKQKHVSCVLYVKGVMPSLISVRELAALFELYGRIEIAVMHRLKDFALVKYHDEADAVRGMEHLNKVTVGGSRLSILFSKYVDINEKRFHNLKDYYRPDDSEYMHQRSHNSFAAHTVNRSKDTGEHKIMSSLRTDNFSKPRPISRCLFLQPLLSYSGDYFPSERELKYEVSNIVRFVRYLGRVVNTEFRLEDHVQAFEFSSVSNAMIALMKLTTTNFPFGRLKANFANNSFVDTPTSLTTVI